MLPDAVVEDADRESGGGREQGVGEGLRSAIERTLAATAAPASSTRDRAIGLLDEVARRGVQARDELARRGQQAGAGLVRRGPGAGDEVSRRLDAIERRLASIEELLRREAARVAEAHDDKPKAEG